MHISIFFVLYRDLGHKILEYLEGADFLNFYKIGIHSNHFQEASKRKLMAKKGIDFVQTKLNVDWVEIYEILLYSDRPSAGICCAARRRDMLTINFFEEKYATENKGHEIYMLGIFGALLGKHYDLVDYFIQKGGKPTPHWIFIFFTVADPGDKPDLIKKFY